MRTEKDYKWIYDGDIPFETLKGKTITKIEPQDDRVFIHTTEGEFCLINFESWCGNNVGVFLDMDSDNDELDRICNSEILLAEETFDHNSEQTYSFYKLSTNNDSVTLRFNGKSNGNYSEKMQLYKIKE